MASKQLKRKRSVITLEKKLQVIGELKKGKSQRCVADLYSIPESTVAAVKRGESRKQSKIGSFFGLHTNETHST